MSHSDVFLETVPKPPPWPQKHTNIKIDNNIKELGNNERNVAYSVCSFVTLLPFIFMSHSDTDTQWLFQKLMLLDRSKVNSLKAFQPIFVTIHMSHEVLHLYRHSYSCHTVTQSHSDFSKRYWVEFFGRGLENPWGANSTRSCGKEEKFAQWSFLQGCADQTIEEEVSSQCQWWPWVRWHCWFRLLNGACSNLKWLFFSCTGEKCKFFVCDACVWRINHREQSKATDWY